MLLTLSLALATPAAAHEIPRSIALHVFVKPDGQRLHLLIRVPLEAMRDIDLPLLDGTSIDLSRADEALRDAVHLWIADNIVLFEEDVRLERPSLLAARVSLPSDRSFQSYDAALAHLRGPPLAATTVIPWNQAMLDVLFGYRIASDRSDFSLLPEFARLGLRVTTVLRFVPPGGAVRAFEYSGDPGLIRLDPRWHQAALGFVARGFFHIFDGPDHLLFLLCLAIPYRRIRPLILVVTSFTVAHSITLVASAFGVAPDALWFPPLVETLIAASIVYMALENVTGATGLRRRWAIAFAFGLVHGFGFSFGLRETMQFAGAHLLTSMLAFNAGVELAQLLALVVLVPVLHALFRYVAPERIGTIILSALIAHTAWHWMMDRWASLRQFGWPALEFAFLATALRWLMLALILAALGWLLAIVLRRWSSTAAGGRVGAEE